MIQKREIGLWMMIVGYVITFLALAYSVLFTTGCTQYPPAKPLKCVSYGRILGNPAVRCEDEIGYCYFWGNGPACLKKSRFDKPPTDK